MNFVTIMLWKISRVFLLPFLRDPETRDPRIPDNICSCVRAQLSPGSLDCGVCGMPVPGRKITCPTCEGRRDGDAIEPPSSITYWLPSHYRMDCPECDGRGSIAEPMIVYRGCEIARSWSGFHRDTWEAWGGRLSYAAPTLSELLTEIDEDHILPQSAAKGG